MLIKGFTLDHKVLQIGALFGGNCKTFLGGVAIGRSAEFGAKQASCEVDERHPLWFVSGDPSREPPGRGWASMPTYPNIRAIHQRSANVRFDPGAPRLTVWAAALPLYSVQRERGGGGAILDAEFGVDLLQVLVNGARAQTEDFADVAVGFA